MSDHSLLKSSPLFIGFSDDEIDIFSSLLTRKEIGEGMAIFVENMAGESLYFILSGTVRISKMISEGEEKTLIVLGPDDFFGEMAIIDGGSRSATARVLEYAVLFALKRVDFDRICKDHPSIALKFTRNILSVFSARIRESNQELREMILWRQHQA